jgi:nicotinamide-nucleotide amidase
MLGGFPRPRDPLWRDLLYCLGREIRETWADTAIFLAGRRRMIPDELLAEADSLLAACRAGQIRLAIAESCTGGLIAATLTAIAGSSDVVDRGFVPYSNEAKHDLLGVPMELIARHGAVSEEVARAMAEGALARSRASIAISVTGVAGPGGGSVEKPVGMVCLGLAQRGQPVTSERHVLPGDRGGIRSAAVAHAFGMMRRRV